MQEIQNQALFIADCHENEKRQDFYNFLLALKSGAIQAPQLFLMGDIFDFLAYNASYTLEVYAKEIQLLQELSEKMELFYFEGNHDFNLARIFPKIKIYPNEVQPVHFKINEKEQVSLSHGDNFLPYFIKKILMFLRKEKMINFLDFFDKRMKRKITKAILKSQVDKKLYREFSGFESFVKNKISNFSTPYIFEGHFHQGKSFFIEGKTYINFEAFGVSKKYYRFIKKGESFILEEKIFPL